MHARIQAEQLIFSGEELCVDRVSLAQLTQLFMASVLECAFYKVRIQTCLTWLYVPPGCLSLISFDFDLKQQNFDLSRNGPVVWPCCWQMTHLCILVFAHGRTAA